MTKADFSTHPLNFDIDQSNRVATGFLGTVRVIEERGRLFQRRAVKLDLSGGSTTTDTVLIAELDGVKVYVHGADIVITRHELKL